MRGARGKPWSLRLETPHIPFMMCDPTVALRPMRAEALAEFLAGWETEHGTLTAAEIARAERELDVATSESAA
jgi:hypothetical protein